MFSYASLLLLQLAAAAAATAILCVICHRDAEIDVRFWLAVAVAAAVLFVADQSKAQSLGGADQDRHKHHAGNNRQPRYRQPVRQQPP